MGGTCSLSLPAAYETETTAMTANNEAAAQLLALAEARGVDPDAPAGLSKVTATK